MIKDFKGISFTFCPRDNDQGFIGMGWALLNKVCQASSHVSLYEPLVLHLSGIDLDRGKLIS
jgi:hypothetical protein